MITSISGSITLDLVIMIKIGSARSAGHPMAIMPAGARRGPPEGWAGSLQGRDRPPLGGLGRRLNPQRVVYRRGFGLF